MPLSAEQLSVALSEAVVKELNDALSRALHCVGQLSDAQLWWRPTAEQNSIANLMLHLSGNARQWIVSGVGGEPDRRDRPAEFSACESVSREELTAGLCETVRAASAVISAQTADELVTTRRIQGFETNVLAAILHVVTHFQGHVQEIVSLTRTQLGAAYRFDFVPQNQEQGAPTSPN